MGFVSEVGDQVARGVNYGVSNFNAPSYLYWWVLPFVVTAIIVGILVTWALSKTNDIVDCKNRVDEEGDRGRVCETRKFPTWLKVVIGLVVTSIAAGTVAAATYKIGVYAYNPKMAAGIETTRYVRSAWNAD